MLKDVLLFNPGGESVMPGLLYARIAIIVYVIGLVMTVVFNIYNGRRASQFQTPESKSNWGAVLFLRGLLIYPSVLVLTYWGIQTLGLFWGLMAGIGTLMIKSFVNHTTYRMF